MYDVKKPIKGVNIGGWLLVERWMTPSLFKGVDARDEASLTLEKGANHILDHRQRFITEDDFIWMSNNGVEAVRIPVGYWILESQDGYVSSPEILDWCFDVAKKYSIKVLISLHGAPGSQNNKDHSGDCSGERPFWYKQENRTKTTEILLDLANRYKDHPSLLGLSVLNEPNDAGVLKYLKLRFWTAGVARKLRLILPSSAAVVFSDAYNFSFWYNAVPKEMIDIHHYQCHGAEDEKITNTKLHIAKLKSVWGWYRYKLKSRSYIVGEWSAVLPAGVEASREDVQEYINEQLKSFSQSHATFYWSYKTEHQGRWNYRSMVEKGYNF